MTAALVDDAVELLDDAELHVRDCEAALAAQVDPTQIDIHETVLREALDLQDAIAEAVAPAVERRRCEVRDQAHEAIRSLRGEVTAPWDAKFRRWHTPAITAFLVRRLGRRTYEKAFPR
jgi:hypothetical protein